MNVILKNIILIIVLLSAISSYSQDFTKTKLTIKADLSFEKNELAIAAEEYKKAYDKTSNKQEKAYTKFKEAECYRLSGNTKKAEPLYKSAISRKYWEPKAYLYLADMLKANGKYDLAKEQYLEYKKLVPNDERADMGAESCDKIVEWMKIPTRYNIKNMKELNSKYSDYAPCYSKPDFTEIYFTSTRPKDNYTKISTVTGEYYTDIFVSNADKIGKWSDPVIVDDTICSPWDDGAPTFASDYMTLYFTRCLVVKNKLLNCQIYKSKMDAQGLYNSVEIVPIVADSITVAHPSISADELTLYFVSDMIGKNFQGGKDIWKVERKNKTAQWGAPINLGPQINTKGNEMFPYIREDGRLYYSSDYLPGIGGLDIFVASPKGTDSWEVQNMKYPINTAQDDFGIVFQGNTEKGLFTSTRISSTFIQVENEDKSAEEIDMKSKGKDDVFYFELPDIEYTLIGKIADANSADPIAKTKVQIIGSDGTDIILETAENGAFTYKLKQNTDYIYIIRNQGYLHGKGEASTKNLANSKTFEKNIILARIGESIKIDNIFYDSGKWDLRDDAKENLKQLIEILQENTNIVIELASHTDIIGDESENEILSQKRAQSVVNFLIEKGIDKERLVAKGYGELKPQTITKRISATSQFKESDILDENFIKKIQENTSITKEEIDKLINEVNQLNRRTEFKVIATDYIPDID
jgi:peptidoglycan-associated lipoprotein